MSVFLKRVKGLWAEALAAAVLLAVTLFVLTQTGYTVLYRDLDSNDTGEVLAVLQEMGIPARPQGPGTILVPAEQAVVTLEIPDIEQKTFTSGDEITTASVMLYMGPETELTGDQIKAVELLVAHSVENLQPENVSITDNLFRRLNHNYDEDIT